MKKEHLYIKEQETTLRVQNTAIDAIRKKTIEKNTLRLFDKQKIGLASSLGKADWNALSRDAEKNLSLGLKYPYPLSADTSDHRQYPLKHPMDDTALMGTADSILSFLREEFPAFRFSQSITKRQMTKQMWNSDNLDLFEESAALEIGLLFKEKSSADLFNGFIAFEGRDFELEKFIDFNRDMLTKFQNPVALPEKRVLPVFFLQASDLTNFLSRSLSAQNLYSGSSVLSGRTGEEIFNEKITLEVNRNPEYLGTSFFDHEGSTLQDDRLPLVEKGVLKRPFADKATASKHNCEATACASGTYDAIPDISRTAPLRFQTDSTSLKSTLNGELAILALISSGGDFTGSGHFAAPVQVSLLFDGEKIIGKLPEFTMKSHLFRMLGADYLGTFETDDFYFGDNAQLLGCMMTIETH